MTSTLPPQHHGGRYDEYGRPVPDHSSPEAVKDSLENRYTAKTGTVHLTGIQALVRMIFDRAAADRAIGLNTASFVSGYEGSPLGGYDLELGRRSSLLKTFDVVHQPGVNEELGATAVAGSQLAGHAGTLKDGIDGVVGYWYGKAPGLDRAADAFRHANVTGTSGTGGAVAIVGDDPTAKSSTVPSNSSRILADLGMPILVPADSADVLSFGTHAAWMSRYAGLWVSLRVTTAVADGSSTVTLDGPLRAPDVANDQHTPSAMLLGKRLLELDSTRTGSRLDRVLEYSREYSLNRLVRASETDTVGIIASGHCSLQVEECLRGLGAHGRVPDNVRVLRLGMVYPLDPAEIARFADGLKHIIVVEELGTHLYDSVRMALYDADHRPPVAHTNETRWDATSAASLAGLLEKYGVEINRPQSSPRRISLPISVAARVPHFCSGCPHNASTRVSEDTLVGAGIGCHAMVMLMDEQRVGNTIGTAQMGGEGSHWIGMNRFIKEKHIVQNMGDGTFLHSGSLALRALVASGANTTFKLLHNGTVAMTGGQDPVGQPSLAGLIRMVQAENVAKIVVTTDDVKRTKQQLRSINGYFGGNVDIRDRKELTEVHEELAAMSGVTVLVHDQHCAAENRRARTKGEIPTPTTRVVINERICEGCGDCGAKSGCLSVQPVDTQFGRKTRIDQTSCNMDYSCLQGDCPAFTTVEMLPKTKGSGKTFPPVELADLPAPEPCPDNGGHSWNVRVTGVGGTGVLTVAAVVATAAQLDGRFVRGSDMTGLAQKGGSVVSDVRISAMPIDEPGTVPRAAADLFFALDGITGAEQSNLDVVHGQRTAAVLSSSANPTGVMCTDITAQVPDGVALTNELGSRARRAVTMDAMEVSRTLLGATTFQTMVMLGAAVQAGALPISVEAIEQALRINGKKVEQNIQAFRRGRQLVAEPAAIQELLDSQRERDESVAVRASSMARSTVQQVLGAAPEELIEDIAMRMEEVRAWGSEQDAQLFLDDVAGVFRAERDYLARAGEAAQLQQATGFQLTTAFAFGLHKVTTYKDEYEVARLATNGSMEQQLEAQFAKQTITDLKIHLHPPMLKALGMKSKIQLTENPVKALKLLAGMKKLRGTPLDVFGYAEVRQVERDLAASYRDRIVEDARTMTTAQDRQELIRLAQLADSVRGYEDLKLNSARAALKQLKY